MMSRFASSSAQSIMGDKCTAAEIEQEVSVMKPIISFMSGAQARVNILCASRMPVHIIN